MGRIITLDDITATGESAGGVMPPLFTVDESLPEGALTVRTEGILRQIVGGAVRLIYGPDLLDIPCKELRLIRQVEVNDDLTHMKAALRFNDACPAYFNDGSNAGKIDAGVPHSALQCALDQLAYLWTLLAGIEIPRRQAEKRIAKARIAKPTIRSLPFGDHPCMAVARQDRQMLVVHIPHKGKPAAMASYVFP